MGITASISILSLGRPEVLRNLRHYPWGQSQGHHTIDHLERGTERGSVWQPSLKGWDRAIVNQVNTDSWKMWSIEELETLPVGTKPRPPHHRSPGERHGKRKCLTTFLERMRQSHCQSGEHCLLEDVKYWGAWDITSGAKPRPPHHRSPGQMSRKRKCLMIFLEKMRESHCQSGEHWNHFKAAKTMWMKFLKGGAELFRAQRIPSWTERNWRWGFKSWFVQQPSSASPYFWGGKQVSSPSDERKIIFFPKH